MHFTEVLELEEQMAQSSLSNQAVNQYIEISTHLINMEDVSSARKLLLSVGFTKKSVEKFIKLGVKMIAPDTVFFSNYFYVFDAVA